jgi:hypothetical protein
MSTRSRPLSQVEIARAVERGQVPVVMTTKRLADFLGVSPKTIYFWLAAGRLDGTYRRRGKHNFFVTTRVLDRIFNGAEWANDKR